MWFSRRHLLPGAVTALLLTAAAPAAAAPGFQADFTNTPAQPAPGQVITLTATTTSDTTSPVRHTWDLDADGQFDDAMGNSAQTSFANAGVHTVRLRAERAGTTGTQESIAERPVTVGTAPQPTPTPSPSPTTTPAATATPDGNAPPVAMYDRRCQKQGSLVYCAGLVGTESRSVLLDATPSSDPDGSIVRYEWDVDNDGTFEHDSGSAPTFRHTFTRLKTLADPMKRTVNLRVTDDKGATDTDTFVINLLEAGCETRATYLELQVTALCIKRYSTVANGKRITRHVISGPATVNGIAVVPEVGSEIRLDVPRKRAGGGPQISRFRPRLFASSARVSMPVDGSVVKLWDGRVDWRFEDHEIVGFRRDPQAKLNGLEITSASPLRPQLGRGTASYGLYVKLPEDFGGPTSSEPVVLRTGDIASASASEPFSFSVPGAELGPLNMTELKVTYDGVNLWTVAAGVALPAPAEVSVKGDASILNNGDFAGAGGELDFGSGVQIGGPVPIYLKSIRFRVNLEPIENECTPHVGVKPNPNPLWVIMGQEPTVDYGIPTFAMCGGIRLTGGPTIPVIDEAAVAVDGRLGFATFEDRPWNFRAFGGMEVAGIPMADATLYVSGSGYTLAYGEYRWGLEDVFHLSGYGRFEFKKTKFNAQAGGEACIDLFELCRGFDGIISSKGVAACLSVDVLVDDWEPGLGYEWGDYMITPYFAGCDVGDYKVHISDNRAAAMLRGAGDRGLTLPAGLPGAVVAADGTTAPPEFTLVGPNGERIPTAGSGKWIERPGVVVAKDTVRNITQVAFSQPAGGRWTVEPAAGSSPIMALRSANGLEEPEVDAQVSGSGHARKLSYDIESIPGQKVTFVERSETAGQDIGVAKGEHGTLRFAPAAGAAEKRTIVAIVRQDGQIRAEVPVTKYAAPHAKRPGKPQRLRVKHAGRSLKVRWNGRADVYKVTATLKDGRRILQSTTKTRAKLRGIGRSVKGRIRVEPVSAAGMPGPAGSATVR